MLGHGKQAELMLAWVGLLKGFRTLVAIYILEEMYSAAVHRSVK